MSNHAKDVVRGVQSRYLDQKEFVRAVEEVAGSLEPVLQRKPEYVRAKVFERLVEPERAVLFRVSWVDDAGEVQVNRGYRVQMNSAIGPYKGGLRFHPSVDLGLLKALAFEQTFKNALTTLPMGGAKGGADFDPKGRSDAEVRRFCQAFMSELYRHIGQFTDVPAGDIGVGGREIGYLFGHYKRIANQFAGVLTGKGPGWGGSAIRPEATGFGAVYFAAEMLAAVGDDLGGKTCLVSGSGNVAQYTVRKLLDLGARPVTLSDSNGFVHDPAGIDDDKLAYVMELKNVRRGRIREYAEHVPGALYVPASDSDVNPMWAVSADCAFPCATEGEISEKDATNLVANGVRLVVEGANLPTTYPAVDLLTGSGVLFGPAKAANAGGVAVSGLEMTQNSERMRWPRDEVDAWLRTIMTSIHRTVTDTAEDYGRKGDYVFGANAAGFITVADAMLDESTV